MRMKLALVLFVIMAVFSGCGPATGDNNRGEISISERGESLAMDVPEPSNNIPEDASALETAQPAKVLILLVNEARRGEGLLPLVEHALLSEMAVSHSRQMAAQGFFDHHDPVLGGVESRAAEIGYSYSALGENIAAGLVTPEEVVAAWLESEGHRENILSPAFTQIGAGYVNDPGSELGSYWTLVVGSP